MAKFKVGDRVKLLDPAYSVYGRIGVVTGVIQGKNAYYAKVESKTYNKALVYFPHELELIGIVSVPAAIDAYIRACEAFEAAQLAVEKAKQDVADARINLRDALDGES